MVLENAEKGVVWSSWRSVKMGSLPPDIPVPLYKLLSPQIHIEQRMHLIMRIYLTFFFAKWKIIVKKSYRSAWVTEPLAHNHASQKTQNSTRQPIWDPCSYFLNNMMINDNNNNNKLLNCYCMVDMLFLFYFIFCLINYINPCDHAYRKSRNDFAFV